MAIITQIDTCDQLLKRHKALQTLQEFFLSCLNGAYNQSDYECGKRVELENGIFAMLQTYALKPYKEAFFETHRKYVDMQLTIRGQECFMIGDFRDFTERTPYDLQRDVIAYYPQKLAHKIVSNRGCLCVFFSHDVHAGGLKHKRIAGDRVYKVVAKIPSEILPTY